MTDTPSTSKSSALTPTVTDNVKVILRCRPPSSREVSGGYPHVVSCTSEKEAVVITNVKGGKSKPTKTFTFDRVYNSYASQQDLFNESISPVIDEVLQGYNCTVFAYGQTGTGKTYTMEGELDSDLKSTTAGVIPRAVATIFERLEGKESNVKISFLELYNEELTDLMSVDDSKKLQIYEDASGKKGMVVNNLEEVMVENCEQVFSVLKTGFDKRRSAATKMNENSSRSHCVFTISVHTKETGEESEDVIRHGKLHLVDLAGSECVGRSGAQNQRAKEAGKINQSLLTLGRCINALVEKSGYVPYRDSKLTRLLQESLGGRSKTIIIATVSPSECSLEESLSTLEYAHRAKKICNIPQVNAQLSRRAYLKELLAEISVLKRENEVLRTKNGIILPPEQWEAFNNSLNGKSAQLQELEMTLSMKLNELSTMTDLFDANKEKLTAVENSLTELTAETEGMRDTLKQMLMECEATKVLLEEQRYLTTIHSKTEQAMDRQSRGLKRALVTVNADALLLQDKIARQQSVQQHNKKASSTFVSQHNTLQTKQAGYVEDFCSVQVSHMHDLSASIASFVAQKEQQTNSIQQAVCVLRSTLHESQSKQHSELCSVLTELRNPLSAFRSDALEQLQACQDRVRLAETGSNTALDSLLSQMAQQKKEVSAWGQALAQQLSAQLAAVQVFSKSQLQRTDQNTAAVSSLQTQHSKAMNDADLSLDEFICNQERRSDAQLAVLMTNVHALMEEFKVKQNQERKLVLQGMQESLRLSSTEGQASCTAIVRGNEQSNAQVKLFQTSCEQETLSYQTTSDQHQLACQTNLAAVKEDLYGAQARQKTAAQEIALLFQQRHAAAVQLVDKEEAVLQDYAVAEATAHGEQIQALTKHADVISQKVNAGLKTDKKHGDQWMETLTKQGRGVEKARQGFQQGASKLTNLVHVYADEKLRSVTSTGTTPTRRTVQLPDSLVPRSQRHTVLRAAFRTARAESKESKEQGKETNPSDSEEEESMEKEEETTLVFKAISSSSMIVEEEEEHVEEVQESMVMDETHIEDEEEEEAEEEKEVAVMESVVAVQQEQQEQATIETETESSEKGGDVEEDIEVPSTSSFAAAVTANASSAPSSAPSSTLSSPAIIATVAVRIKGKKAKTTTSSPVAVVAAAKEEKAEKIEKAGTPVKQGLKRKSEPVSIDYAGWGLQKTKSALAPIVAAPIVAAATEQNAEEGGEEGEGEDNHDGEEEGHDGEEYYGEVVDAEEGVEEEQEKEEEEGNEENISPSPPKKSKVEEKVVVKEAKKTLKAKKATSKVTARAAKAIITTTHSSKNTTSSSTTAAVKATAKKTSGTSKASTAAGTAAVTGKKGAAPEIPAKMSKAGKSVGVRKALKEVNTAK